MAFQVITVQLPGSPGPAGAPNNLTIGTVTTLAPGSEAVVTVSGQSPNQQLNFQLPSGPQGATGPQGIQGIQGPQGTPGTNGKDGAGIQVAGDVATYSALPTGLTSADAGKAYIVDADGKLYIWSGTSFPANGSGQTFVGPAGPANTLTVGTVTTGAAGASATATITGTAPNQTLNLTIPQGIQGATGAAGPTGPANSLTVGTVTATTPGGTPSATITGSAPNQTLNLVLPKGDTGPAGPTGPAGTAGQGVIAGGASGDVLMKNSATDYDTKWSAPQSANVIGTVVKRDSSGNVAFQRAYVDSTTVPAVSNELTPKSYVDGVLPIVAAGSNVTISSSTTAGQTTYTVSSTGGGTGSDGDWGAVSLDSFAGSTDDAKLANALSAVSADTYKRTILLSNRKYTFTTANRVAFHGMRIQGPGGYSNADKGSVYEASEINLSMTGPWFNNNNADVFDVSLRGLSFKGSSTATVLGQVGSTPSWWRLHMRDISSSGLSSICGTNASKLLVTGAFFDGFWEINNCYSTAFHLGGSDNRLFSNGGFLDSSPAFAGSTAGMCHLWCDYLDNTTIGPLYITAESVWTAIQIDGPGYGATGSNSGGPISFTGLQIEGRNIGAGSNGALVRMNGGIARFRDCNFNYAMINPTQPGRTPVDAGVIHHVEGQLVVDGASYDRATGVAETVPLVYTASTGKCIVRSVQPVFHGGTWTTGLPRVALKSGNTDNRITDTTVTLSTV